MAYVEVTLAVTCPNCIYNDTGSSCGICRQDDHFIPIKHGTFKVDEKNLISTSRRE
jgi:hypothetical protein